MDFDDAMHAVNAEDSTPSTALGDMSQQFGIATGYAFNLSSMWRTVGRPEDKDPAAWLRLAAPLIEGLGAYQRALDEFHAMPEDARLAWSREDLVFMLNNDALPRSNWLVGDLMAVQCVAMAYARFLDGVDANG
jgi:hypothetical protein